MDYFGILKALIILFSLHICLYEFMFQNGKFQEETPGRFKFRCCENNIETFHYFKMTLPLFQVVQKSLPIPLLLCHIQ